MLPIALDGAAGRPVALYPARRARASIAAGDRAACYLWLRGLTRRQGAAGNSTERAELAGLVREVGAIFDDPQRSEKRWRLERCIEAAKSLRGRPEWKHKNFDGTMQRSLARCGGISPCDGAAVRACGVLSVTVTVPD